MQYFHPCVVNDNDELANRANILLVRMCGVSPPRPLIHPLLDTIFEAIQSSPVRPMLRVTDLYANISVVVASTIEGSSSGPR